MSEVKRFEGQVVCRSYGETDDAIFLSDDDVPLTERLDFMRGKHATVRYWIADAKLGTDEIKEEFIKKVAGATDVRFCPHYSDYTGYLWTDQDLNVGGHDLMAEIQSHIGKWVVLEIEV